MATFIMNTLKGGCIICPVEEVHYTEQITAYLLTPLDELT